MSLYPPRPGEPVPARSARACLQRALAGAALACFFSGVAAEAQPGSSVAVPAGPASTGGPKPAPPGPNSGPVDRPVSLEEAIQIGEQSHARVAVAEELVAAARQRVRQVRTGTLPSVTGSIGYQGRGTSSLNGLFGGPPTQTVRGAPGQPTRTQELDVDSSTFDQGLQPRFGLTYTPFDGGITRQNVRQARAGVESNTANLNAVRNNLAFDVTTDYLTQLRAERLLELRQVQEELAAEQLRRVEARIVAGSAAAADRALALSELRNRQVDRIQAANDVRVAATRLRNTMGLAVGPPLRLVELRENPDPLAPMETLRDMARRQRPEVVQAEAQVRAAQAGVAIARIGRRPRLTTSFTYDITPNDPFNRSAYTVAAGVSLPIWDAGLTQARELEAKTQVQSTSAELEQAKKDVTAEVDEAYFNLSSARERLAASRLAVQAAQVNLEQTTARYELGIANTTVVDLIEAQVQFAQANNNAIAALYDVHLAQAQLNRAIGR